MVAVRQWSLMYYSHGGSGDLTKTVAVDDMQEDKTA